MLLHSPKRNILKLSRRHQPFN